MSLKIALTIAALYMALIGVGHLVAPVALSAGVIPADASSSVVAFLRHYGALFLGMAVLNGMARSAGPSEARNAIVVGNLVVFFVAALLDIVTVLSGAGPTGLVPAAMNTVIGLLILWASRTSAA